MNRIWMNEHCQCFVTDIICQGIVKWQSKYYNMTSDSVESQRILYNACKNIVRLLKVLWNVWQSNVRLKNCKMIAEVLLVDYCKMSDRAL